MIIWFKIQVIINQSVSRIIKVIYVTKVYASQFVKYKGLDSLFIIIPATVYIFYIKESVLINYLYFYIVLPFICQAYENIQFILKKINTMAF